ncbi:MAG: nucleotide exchange factor GrpE [Chloroflexi bacterium RBG_16_57_9]|nr:MAG: nucleotide exchange factor GrpE [Chloroflexi bacterium RBG_16_57_9]
MELKRIPVRNAQPTGTTGSQQNQPGPESTPSVNAEVVAAFEKELVAARRLADENHDNYLRAMAELDNVRKRVERTYEQRLDNARRDFLRRFLSVADNLELALAHAGTDTARPDHLREGIELTYRDLQRVLADEGIKTMEPVGQPFDPRFHEAVETVVSDTPDGTVVAEIQKGYLYGDQLLRPAKVRVAKQFSW